MSSKWDIQLLSERELNVARCLCNVLCNESSERKFLKIAHVTLLEYFNCIELQLKGLFVLQDHLNRIILTNESAVALRGIDSWDEVHYFIAI